MSLSIQDKDLTNFCFGRRRKKPSLWNHSSIGINAQQMLDRKTHTEAEVAQIAAGRLTTVEGYIDVLSLVDIDLNVKPTDTCSELRRKLAVTRSLALCLLKGKISETSKN